MRKLAQLTHITDEGLGAKPHKRIWYFFFFFLEKIAILTLARIRKAVEELKTLQVFIKMCSFTIQRCRLVTPQRKQV